MWHLHYGSWWMIQWQWNGWLSLGIHVDCKRRVAARPGRHYGPYLDLHLGCLILSLGRWPVYSGELEYSVSVGRGGLAA